MASTYTWSLQSGTIPTGMVLNTAATGLSTLISGVPTAAGTYNFTVRVTNDISGESDDQAYSVIISPGGSPDVLYKRVNIITRGDPTILLY